MSFTLPQLFPGIETGLNRIGFLFGAGTSKEAGYPLMDDLTQTVVNNLSSNNKTTLDEILSTKGLAYDLENGEPNIEVLSDLVTVHSSTNQGRKYKDLETEIQQLIVQTIISISPNLGHHISFLEALKRRAHDTSSIVTILTTNYDVLFELAAGEVGLRIETGFDGPLIRIFDPTVFSLSRGTMEKARYTPRNELQINLIKLHGSISWLNSCGKTTESGLFISRETLKISVVLPHRQKFVDALAEPFDQLFTTASQALGSSCKFLVSCGFSFNDKHINDQLIFPKLNTKQIRMTALCGEVPECLNELKKFKPFHAGFPDNCYIDGTDTGSGTELWKFSELVKLLQP